MGIFTDAQQAMAPQASPATPQQSQPPAQGKPEPQCVRLAKGAGALIYKPEMRQGLEQKLMADGKLDEDEGGELVVNLITAGLEQIQQGGEASDPKQISVALMMISQLVAEFCVKIEALPQEQLAAYAKAVLPCAVALFKIRVVDKQGGQQAEQEPTGTPENQAPKEVM
ncbi:MAG: hypothetical protein NT086_12430 [Proteobacteria bacterium]|nr:hypothetical protein [Pseudomonadota bacterium]